MAKKIVRGITDVKTINNQDFDTNNVNDLLSDGQYNYIHRKKGKNEEYHNLTDNIKTISSDNTELLSVTNYNKTTNTATLHPKHDKQKEQVLESTRNTITIHHGTNGTAEKTTVDTNPQKVLEHENLISDSEYITLNHQQGENSTHIKTAPLKQELNELHETKQDVLTAGEGITIQDNVISASESLHIVSDSEYITLDHQTGENTTHIKTESLKQELQQIIQAIDSSGLSTIKYFQDTNFKAYEHRVETIQGALLTFSFQCYNAAETVLTGDLKLHLEHYFEPNTSISNGAISISYDGTNMKLINSAPSENVIQHATFTFNGYVPS